VQFTNYVTTHLENFEQVDVIFTDFSKAFDKLNHSILLNKLSKFGIYGMLFNWIKSYLCNRTQFVQMAGFLSNIINVTSGVPQGSHIGPLLFLIFINDINTNLNYTNCLLYADDMKFFSKISSMMDCLAVQNDLNNISIWCEQNKLHLNVSKCKSI